MHRSPFRILLPATAAVLAVVLAAGCSRETPLAPAGTAAGHLKNGTETLGPPDIALAGGARFVEGGVSLVGVASADLTVDVPAGAQIRQVLLYWAGGTTAAAGDDEISLDGVPVQGDLIGGPTLFYENYSFSAYRADITGLDLVQPGANTLTVADFEFTGAAVDENDGASVVVLYDDGGAAQLTLRDGLDMAYFGFAPTLNATVPQVFAVTPSAADRTAELMIIAASVGENRPNAVRVTTAAGDQVFASPLGSYDGLQWDSTVLTVDVPAGADALEVEVISTDSDVAQGASLGWVVAALSVPEPAPEPGEAVSGTVFVDADRNGTRGDFEWGIPDVTVTLSDLQGGVWYALTDAAGAYAFAVPAGDYTVTIEMGTGPDGFNSDLAASFAPTATTSRDVTVPPAATGVDFGFAPRIDDILMDLDSGELTSNALPALHWRKLMRRALIEESSNRQDHRYDDPAGGGGGWGHDENYYGPDELRAILAQVQALYLPEPYRFTPGDELREAYDLLQSHPRDLEGQVLREMFVTELNYVTGRGIIGQADRTGVLISWGEALLNFTEEPAKAGLPGDKARSDDLAGALSIFGAINPGGGGGVDE